MTRADAHGQASTPIGAADSDEAALLSAANRYLIRCLGEFLGPVVERARGTELVGLDGRVYLDFGSGQMCATLGHNSPGLAEALQRGVETVLHLNSTMLSPAVVHLAERLAGLLPPPLQRTMLLSTGSESTEVAIKLAKKATGRFEIVGLAGGFHGLTGGALGATYTRSRRGAGPTVPGNLAVPAPYAYRCPIRHCQGKCDCTCLEAGFDLVDAESVGSLAACIAEPVLSSGGIIDPPPGYLGRLLELCHDREMLLILDEGQTGFGRTGTMFTFEQEQVVPDLLALSKTLGAGLPLAAAIATDDVEARAVQAGFTHITSHVNDPMLGVVGLAVVEMLTETPMIETAMQRAAHLRSRLEQLMERHPLIGDVRGRGLLLGVELVRDRKTKEPAEAAGRRLTRMCRERGLILQTAGLRGKSFVWRVAPPLTVTDDEIDRALSILDSAIAESVV